MPFDFKKEYKEFYRPTQKPVIVEIPEMNFLAVKGKGNPNEEMGEYKVVVGLLYTIAYTLKMSYRGSYKIEGYYEYVVPLLKDYGDSQGQVKLIIRIKINSTGFL